MWSVSLKIGPPLLTDFERTPKFQQSALKLYWARMRAHHACVVWETICQQHFEAATGGQNNLPYPIHENLLCPPIPIELPLLVGDCVRNMRSALDYLVSEMARATGLSDNNTTFPFSLERAGLEASFHEPLPNTEHRKGRRAGALYELSRKYPNLKNIILDDIQPYSAEDGANPLGDMLWRVVTSDNIDKHRLMPLAVQTVMAKDIRTSLGQRIAGGMGIIGNVIQFPPNTKLDKKSKLELNVVFEEPARLADRPVMSALIEGCNAVTEIIKIFRNEFDLTPAK